MTQQTEPDWRGFFCIVSKGVLRRIAIESGNPVVRVVENGKTVGYYDGRKDPYFDEAKARLQGSPDKSVSPGPSAHNKLRLSSGDRKGGIT